MNEKRSNNGWVSSWSVICCSDVSLATKLDLFAARPSYFVLVAFVFDELMRSHLDDNMSAVGKAETYWKIKKLLIY